MTYPQEPWHGQTPPLPAPGPPPYPIAQFPAGGALPAPPKRGTSVQVALISAVTLVLLCCGGVIISTIVAAPPEPQGQKQPAAEAVPTVPAADATPPVTVPASPQQVATPTGAAEPTTPAAPVVRTRTVTETQRIAFQTRTIRDSSLPKGTRKVSTRGVAGVRTLTYQVTHTDGVQTARKLVKSEITKAPVTRVVRVGTKETRQCDPNYSGACVPIASDVDCAGGSGNGPAYVHGPVRVVGSDIYDLDRDGDGIGCDD
ncbi:G5 domain-containing protein [Micromonospora sp. NPDC049048]|uniref:G5 domain-containing protein n=1 Tax=Micromonospora sp. NPDC049048 TaxID=3364263 RepID=UPI0037130DFE